MMPIGARGFTLVEADGKDEAGEPKFKMTDLSSIQGEWRPAPPCPPHGPHTGAPPLAVTLFLATRAPHAPPTHSPPVLHHRRDPQGGAQLGLE